MAQPNTESRTRFKSIAPTNAPTAQNEQRDHKPSRATTLNTKRKAAKRSPRSKRWTADKVAIAKAMHERGDRQHDIAAYFGVNGGRVGEMDKKWPDIKPHEGPLPPSGPYDIPRLVEARELSKRRMATVREDIVDTCAEIEQNCEPNKMLSRALSQLMRCAETLDRPI